MGQINEHSDSDSDSDISKTSTPLRPLRYNFVTELIHLLCDVFANYTFWHKKIRIKLDH